MDIKADTTKLIGHLTLDRVIARINRDFEQEDSLHTEAFYDQCLEELNTPEDSYLWDSSEVFGHFETAVKRLEEIHNEDLRAEHARNMLEYIGYAPESPPEVDGCRFDDSSDIVD